MAASVQEKVIVSGHDSLVPVPSTPTVSVQPPVIPSQAPTLVCRAVPKDVMDSLLESFSEDEEDESNNSKVSPEELLEIIDWIRANPELTSENLEQVAHGIRPSESSIEDEFVFVESSTTPFDQSTETEKKSQPGLMSRIGRSFRNAVSYFYSGKK